MTKKDYIKIAEIIKDKNFNWKCINPKLAKDYQIRLTVLFSDMLKKDNDRFDKDKFFDYIFNK